MSEINTPKCYNCKYRGEVAGSCHSSCHHPKLGGAAGEMIATLVFANAQQSLLGIKGNRHGINSGWFMWPINFDPVWLEACEGFTPIDEQLKKGANENRN